jgi:hypothetical protein
VTPTRTVTPTSSTPVFSLSACDVVFSNSSISPYQFTYNVSTNIKTSISTPTLNSQYVAKTSNRLWLDNGTSSATVTNLNEYVLVQSPYSVSLNRAIAISNNGSGNFWTGFLAYDNTTLIGGNGTFPTVLRQLDITTTTATQTVLWSTPVTRQMVGNPIFTTAGKLLYLNIDNAGTPNTYITQRDYLTGALEYELQIGSAGDSYTGLFYNGFLLYTVKNGGNVYLIDPCTPPYLTLVGSTTVNAAAQAAQTASCMTISQVYLSCF